MTILFVVTLQLFFLFSFLGFFFCGSFFCFRIDSRGLFNCCVKTIKDEMLEINKHLVHDGGDRDLG